MWPYIMESIHYEPETEDSAATFPETSLEKQKLELTPPVQSIFVT